MSAKPLILAVDDEQDIIHLMKRVLERENYEVITASNGNQALELVAERNPDLVLLDIKMPGKSGTEVLEELRAKYPDTAVIMATAITDMSVAINAMRNGAYDYQSKPFNLEEIVISIERALERRRLILENRDYQLHLEEKVAEQTWLLEQKVRELTALNNLFVTYLNQGFEAAETHQHLAVQIIKAAEQIQALAKEAEARKVEIQTPPEKTEGSGQ